MSRLIDTANATRAKEEAGEGDAQEQDSDKEDDGK
jgi:ribosome-binding factor A